MGDRQLSASDAPEASPHAPPRRHPASRRRRGGWPTGPPHSRPHERAKLLQRGNQTAAAVEGTKQGLTKPVSSNIPLPVATWAPPYHHSADPTRHSKLSRQAELVCKLWQRSHLSSSSKWEQLTESPGVCVSAQMRVRLCSCSDAPVIVPQSAVCRPGWTAGRRPRIDRPRTSFT